MDRNRNSPICVLNRLSVALRKESVDRNNSVPKKDRQREVALRKESVDRNCAMQIVIIVVDTSLSARRAWIEIHFIPKSGTLRSVALRKESVDRNIKLDVSYNTKETSLSARRAWIEIRNGLAMRWNTCGRSPQGERG